MNLYQDTKKNTRYTQIRYAQTYTYLFKTDTHYVQLWTAIGCTEYLYYISKVEVKLKVNA